MKIEWWKSRSIQFEVGADVITFQQIASAMSIVVSVIVITSQIALGANAPYQDDRSADVGDVRSYETEPPLK
jgi:hypothetical protein